MFWLPCYIYDMLLKERNPKEHQDIDKFAVAGAKAEEQMAFYLRRTFANDPNVFIVNDLRLESVDNDATQVDHLVIHRHGFILIESKSVTTKVKINEYNEWTRLWGGHWTGMPSPVQQVKRQAEYLKEILHHNREKLLLEKMAFFLQQGLKNCPFDIFVAISDRGIIQRSIEVPEVVKAERIPDMIKDIYEKHRKATSSFSISKESMAWSSNIGLYTFSDDDISRISDFLIKHHYPRGQENPESVKEAPSEYKSDNASPSTTSQPEPKDESLGICDKCGTQSVILWGKYNYYWKCPSCQNNMAIKEYCPVCKKRLLLRKDHEKYFIYCEHCGNERLYYRGNEFCP